MYKPLEYIIIALPMCIAALFFSPAYAYQDAAAAVTQQLKREPLMVIRFNEQNVYYGRTLTMAVQKTLELKQEATFDVLLLQGLGMADDYRLKQIINDLMQRGVLKENIRIARTQSQQHYDEIHIYVQ